MSATPQDVQALIDQGVADLEKVTSKYSPTGKNWKPALAAFAAARAEAGLLIAPSPPAPPTPPVPPPSGTILFDGRASAMASMDSYETDQAHANLGPVSVGGQTLWYQTNQAWKDTTHAPWDCVCYGRGIGHNFKILPDAHYGSVFDVTCKIGDTNQWGGNTGGNVNGAAEVSKRRILHTDGWAWFAIAVMVPAWVGDPANLFFFDLASLGYQTSQGDQVALTLDGDSGKLQFSMSSNAGLSAENSGGWYAGSVAYKTPFLPVTFGQWEEFCIGVKAATDDTGEVQVYHRSRGGSWGATPIFDFKGATELYGPTPEGTFPQDIEGQGVIDKIGMYYGLHDQTVVTQNVQETGLVVCPDLATAQATFPA